MPYEEFLQRPVLRPLGMKETTFWPTEAQVARPGGAAYGRTTGKSGLARGDIGSCQAAEDRVRRFPKPGWPCFFHHTRCFRYGLMLANEPASWTAGATCRTQRWNELRKAADWETGHYSLG